MLISSDVASLGAALRSSSPNMETKGIASHRAPVSTINAYRAGKEEIKHDDFVRAVKEEFVAAYAGNVSEYDVHEEDVELPVVHEGVEDLKVSWDITTSADSSRGNGSMARRQSSRTRSRARCRPAAW